MQDLDAAAREILRKNDRGGYTVPTDGLYPYQWNWDSAFAAWGFSTFDVERAWEEFESLFSGQWSDGMVPHIVFHKPDPGYFPGPDVWGGTGPIPSSGISQPPVAATHVRAVHEAAPEQSRIAAFYPKLLAWHRWFMEWRLDRGAVCITHPWEAGRDNAPDWDPSMAAIEPHGVGTYQRRDTSHVDASMRPTKADYDRYIWLVQMGRRLDWDQAALLQENPFRIADPTMTFILLRANRDLAALGQTLGADISEIDGWISELEAGVATLWNDALGAYDARDAKTGRFANCLSNASCMCFYAGIDDARMLVPLERMLTAVTYGVPSHDPASDSFDAKRYWRGPVWAMVNTMIGLGLAECGHDTLAVKVRQDTRDLISRFGFAEYFDPVDGSPAGGGTFTWTAAVWLAWVSPSAEGA